MSKKDELATRAPTFFLLVVVFLVPAVRYTMMLFLDLHASAVLLISNDHHKVIQAIVVVLFILDYKQFVRDWKKIT